MSVKSGLLYRYGRILDFVTLCIYSSANTVFLDHGSYKSLKSRLSSTSLYHPRITLVIFYTLQYRVSFKNKNVSISKCLIGVALNQQLNWDEIGIPMC